MKKFLTILLVAVLCMAVCIAMAEDDEKPFVDFDIRMDDIPEGYTYTVEEAGGSLYATFMPDDPDGLIVYVSVAYSDSFAGYTLSEISDEEFDNVRDMLAADYNDPIVEIQETEHGNKLIIIDEDNAQSDYADMYSIWHGYFFHAGLQKNSTITEADLEIANKIASDMWIVEE